MARRVSRVLYWVVTAIAIVVTIYLEMLFGPDALDNGEWAAIGLIAILGFLIWSVGLAISCLLLGRR